MGRGGYRGLKGSIQSIWVQERVRSVEARGGTRHKRGRSVHLCTQAVEKQGAA